MVINIDFLTTKELTYLLKHPESLKKNQIHDLEKIVNTFPYYQAARALFLKGLKEQESFRYNLELKKTAAHTTDREVLFEFITSASFNKPNKIQDKPAKENITVYEAEEVKVLERIPLDEAVTMKMEEAEDVLDPSLFELAKDENQENESPEIISDNDDLSSSKISVLEIDKPLEFDKNENHSFAEWLKLTNAEPIQRAKNADSKDEKNINTAEDEDLTSENSESPLPIEKKFELIDDFIANTPKIKPVAKNATIRNLAKENQVAPDELMTETLAKVYLAQNNYKKAIQAYKILILKNPEKSGFFADQIRAIEKLQDTNND